MKMNFQGYELDLDVAEDDGRVCFGVEAIRTDGAIDIRSLAEWLSDNEFAITQQAHRQLEREIQQARFEAQEDAA